MSNDEQELQHIAVIGMAGRFPSADSVEQFWENVSSGKESIRYFNDDELRQRGVSDDTLNNPAYVKSGFLLDGVEDFDAEFFDYTANDAAITDPQQRLLLECAFSSLENAGYDPTACSERVGVFAGVGAPSYLIHHLMPSPGLIDRVGTAKLSLSNEKSFAATNISYRLNLNGPSLTVDTACSTSLVAIHQACQSLLTFECDMALAGGSSIDVTSDRGYLYMDGNVGAIDGHCRAFDDQASGTVRGNGAGVVVLKRLEDALSDGDSIRAVIIGSAINNDGSDKVGFTAPSVSGQAKVIEDAYTMAGVDPRTISYVETHGTGTKLGDPIEAEALTRAFRSLTDDTGFCALGSLKPNIGHLDAAAGVAGLIKSVCALENSVLPPCINFQTPNRQIDFDSSPFFVNTELREWEAGSTPRRAAVSSFGIGGTNAHVVLQEAPQQASPKQALHDLLFCLSADTPEAAARLCQSMATFIQARPEVTLASIAHTLQIGRKPRRYRYSMVANSRNGAFTDLSRVSESDIVDSTTIGSAPQAWCFSGNVKATRSDLERFAATFFEFDGFLNEAVKTLKDDFGTDLNEDLADAPLASVLLEVGIARVFLQLGLEPVELHGVGYGELAAAYVAQILNLDDILTILLTPEKFSGVETIKSRPSVFTTHLVSSGVTITQGAAASSVDALFKTLDGSGQELDIDRLNLAERNALWLSTGTLFNDSDSVKASKHSNIDPGHQLLTLKSLWISGADFSWLGFQSQRTGRVGLPGYPFARSRHWVDRVTVATTQPFSENVSANESANTGQDSDRSEMSLEAQLELVWRELFGLAELSDEDDFFELGGDSLLASQLVSRITAELKLNVPVQTVFDHSTFGDFKRTVVGLRLDEFDDSQLEQLISEIEDMAQGV